MNPDIADLYRGDLGDFIARRKALATALRVSDPDAAAAVARLRKPSLSAWAIDQVAASRPDVIADLLAAGADAREAQQRVAAGSGSGDELRTTSGRVRDTLDAVARAAESTLSGAGHATGDETNRQIRTTLQSAAAGGIGARLALWRGTLDGNLGPAGFGDDTGLDADPPDLAAALAPLRRRPEPGAARAPAASTATTRDAAAQRAAAQVRDAARRAREAATAKREQADRLAHAARAAEDEAVAAEQSATAAEARATESDDAGQRFTDAIPASS